jgi:thiol-disulfide isomerase/thioredoxin
MSAQSQKGRKVFVFLSACAVSATIVVLAAQAIERSGPAHRIRALMPVIGAQVVDQPLSGELADHRLEMPPPRADAPPSRFGTIASFEPGTLIFLNFWATWCEPCVRELPSMRGLARKLGAQKFAMVAVSYDDDWETILEFFKGAPKDLHVWRDPKQESKGPDKALRLKFGTDKLPETYVIRDGQILARFVNERNWTNGTIVEYFERLLELK